MDYKDVWRECLSHIQLSLSKTHFKAWFSHSSIQEMSDNVVTIGAKNKIAREYFENEFYDVIKESLQKVLGKQVQIKFVITPKEKDIETKDAALPPLFAGDKSLEVVGEPEVHNQYMQAITLLGINPKYTFDNFIVGSSNRLAHAAAMAVAENPGFTYNPLFIYGNTGLGKTHLIQAIANQILLNNPQFKMSYCSSEVFLNDMTSALRSGTLDSFRKKYREKGMLIIDDIQFIEGKKGTQEEVFHTFNAMYQFNKQIIIASDRPPEEMPFLEARLRSRFEGGMVVDIGEPDFETRLAIIQKKCEEKGYNIDREVLQFAAQKFTANIRELEGALTKLGSLSILGKSQITMKDAVKLLGPQASKKNLRIKPSDIISAVCDTYNISLKELKSPVRTERIAFSRQVAMYLLRMELNLPLTEVARVLNRKDHTTVLHAVDKIETLKQIDEDVKYDIEQIIRIFKH